MPPQRVAIVADPQITFNYTTVLNILFLLLAAWLVVRAARTGVRPMLGMMDALPETAADLAPDAIGTGDYTCPMHPDVPSDAPGRCLKCGMALVARARAH